jgi:L-alanine-DL-glutamate epimerase-like enolase superfamily enzyme
MMVDDILKQPLPIASGPVWNAPEGPGLGIEVDEDKLRHYHECYRRSGQFVPYDPALL